MKRPIHPCGAIGRVLLAIAAAAALSSCARPEVSEVDACSALARLKLGHVQITAATALPASRGFSLLRTLIGVPFLAQPAACRVRGAIRPVPGSDIGFEVLLPRPKDWNGRLQGIGNGGFAGSIDALSLSVALHRGYAAAATDTGHVGGDKDGAWALHHPVRIDDYGYRAIHETTVAAKALVRAYYGRPQRRAYFGSASNGGREGLIEAQRYPDDYDGILAGAPALDATDTISSWAANQQLLSRKASWISPAKLQTVAAAVMRECDGLDGATDGLIENPQACHFRPETLQCKGADTPNCLTPPQIATLKRIYDGPDYGGHPWGFEPGGELGWKIWITGAAPGEALERGYARDFFRYLVYGDPRWNIAGFEYGRDHAAMKHNLGPAMDAVSPDLQAFRAHGGKLILYHGWSDPALQPQATIDYYKAVQMKMGPAQTQGFVRLYMAPGVEHVFGGPGPNAFGQMPGGGTGDPHSDVAAALVAWVEDGAAPGPIVVGHYDSAMKPLISASSARVRRTRPICPYPQQARWTGKGSVDLAADFRCVLALSAAN